MMRIISYYLQVNIKGVKDGMEKGKNMMLMVYQNLKENISMDKNMERLKNIMIIIN